MTSPILQLPISYLLWHYTTAWTDLLRLYKNFSWFLWNFFSIRILFETLFSPWHRIKEHAEKDTGGLLGSIILNLILRLIGFFARAATIVWGILALVLFSILFSVFFVLWAFLPILIIGSVLYGTVGLVRF